MDPQACLMAAMAALDEGDVEAFREAMRNYRNWRRAGGFEPVVQKVLGDEFAGMLCDRYESWAGDSRQAGR